MSDVQIKVEGLREVKAALSQLAPQLAERITRIALRQGANHMLKQIRAAAPAKTGRLRKAIKVKNSRINTLKKNGIVGVYITISKGKNRKDTRGAWYGKFVEGGYNIGSKAIDIRRAIKDGMITIDDVKARNMLIRANRKSGKKTSRLRYKTGGKHVEGKFFVKNTFEATKDQSARIIVQASEEAAKNIIKRLGGG